MDEFDLNNNEEIGTSVSSLQNLRNKQISDKQISDKQINNKQTNKELLVLIKDLESRLDYLEDTKPIETIKVFSKNKTNDKIKYSEIIIYMIIFIILNNKFTVTLIHNLPYFNKSDNPYPNLILRTILFGLIIYLYKRFAT